MNRSPSRVAAAAAAWWIVLTLLFMLLSGESTTPDWVGAAACAALAAVAATVMTRMGLFHLRFRAGWLRSLPGPVKQVFVDFWVVTAFLARAVARGERGTGVFVARRDFPAGDDGPEGTAWRAFVSLTSTLSPNSYVVDIDHGEGNRLSHDLVPARRSEEPA